MALPRSALLQSLASTSQTYYGRLEELRATAAQWLEYVPHTFPHYTRHGVSHSDEIISELSQLLYFEGDTNRPVVQLSPTEIFVLCASAYLHDSGMVVADSEKLEILSSEPWRRWTTHDGGGAKRWREIQAFRVGVSPEEPTLREFLADVQTRFLISEFVRRTHHIRVRMLLADQQNELAACALGDPSLLRTIADVCVAHGLESHELQDPERYPDRRTIRGDQVNVRFLGVLLRLGDLLDMSSNRACPLLMGAASPIPADSVGHWSQYKRIIHRVTAPDRIEITAECETQEEHRLLQGWCTWLVREAQSAELIMSRAARHAGWKAPDARIDPPAPTIKIRPASGALYRPSRWIFELDPATVFERLVRDVYQFPMSFVRELLQNALDASRTQMYADLRNAGETVPRFPTSVAAEWREKYPIHITVNDITIVNPLSGESEKQQVVHIEDSGTGMDSDIIQRYLLQIGRSYYTSKEFVDNYPFVPTSRFGIGFLSVFAVSEHVDIETLKPSSSANDGPIHLTLTGPRAYLLTTKGTRSRGGTRVSVRLREKLERGALTELLLHWCKRVEFPVFVSDQNVETRIDAEPCKLESFEALREDGEKSADIVVRSYPVKSDLVEGEIFVAAYIDGSGESWIQRYRIRELGKTHPLIGAQVVPGTWICLHGINLAPPHRAATAEFEDEHATDSIAARIDIRGKAENIALARVHDLRDLRYNEELMRALEPTYEEVITSHLRETVLAQGPSAWQYKQRLADELPFIGLWLRVPGTLRAFRGQVESFISMQEFLDAPAAGVVLGESSQLGGFASEEEVRQAAGEAGLDVVLAGGDLRELDSTFHWRLMNDRPIIDVRLRVGSFPTVVFGASGTSRAGLEPFAQGGTYGYTPIILMDFPVDYLFALSLRRDYFYKGPLLLNKKHPYTKWLSALVEDSRAENPRIGNAQLRKLLRLVGNCADVVFGDANALGSFIRAWRSAGTLPSDLAPPEAELDPASIGGTTVETRLRPRGKSKPGRPRTRE